MERKTDLIIAENKIKECVITSLQGEVERLQQYTRRYSVVIAGVDRPNNEKPADLKEKVESIVRGVQSETTVADIDIAPPQVSCAKSSGMTLATMAGVVGGVLFGLILR